MHLYHQWLQESNKGHYKQEFDIETDTNKLFGNQDWIVEELSNVFEFYHLPFQGRVLDVGCSMGGLLFSLYKSHHFSHISGCDIDKTAIAMAQAYKVQEHIGDEVDLCEASIDTLPYSNEIFDVILMKDVGEHLENEENLYKALNELQRVLKPEGVLFIETPNYYFPFEVHLKIPMLPWVATKKSTQCIAKFFKKDSSFIHHLNFTTPKMFETVFKKLDLHFMNAYEEYKLSYVIQNPNKLSNRYRFVGQIFRCLRFLKLADSVVLLFKKTKMYPSLWYIVRKKPVCVE